MFGSLPVLDGFFYGEQQLEVFVVLVEELLEVDLLDEVPVGHEKLGLFFALGVRPVGLDLGVFVWGQLDSRRWQYRGQHNKGQQEQAEDDFGECWLESTHPDHPPDPHHHQKPCIRPPLTLLPPLPSPSSSIPPHHHPIPTHHHHHYQQKQIILQSQPDHR